MLIFDSKLSLACSGLILAATVAFGFVAPDTEELAGAPQKSKPKPDPAPTPKSKPDSDTPTPKRDVRPYDITRARPTKVPQIVAAASKTDLYAAWQSWGASGPGEMIIVSKVALKELAEGRWATVREVASLGALDGFAIDNKGVDYVITVKPENPPNVATEDFVKNVQGERRKNIAILYTGGKPTDLNNKKFTPQTLYGLTSAGSGRLVAGGTSLAWVFARRHYNRSDNLIHQEADDLLVSRNLATVQVPAANSVSHSFDQRLIFDGTDFIALHQADEYPFPGLIIEKIRTRRGLTPPIVRFLAYATPTFRNSVYFELGGLVAEADGYPILFTATRSTEPVNEANEMKLARTAWDLALVYVERKFDLRRKSKNPYDVVGSGVLAGAYAKDEAFTVDNFRFNPKTIKWDVPETRAIKRRVLWLTENNPTTRASHAKLVKLRAGRYIAVWEEHKLARRGWEYATTRAMVISSSGTIAKKVLSGGDPVELKGVRLHQGDDALAVDINGASHAAWITADADKMRLVVHTLDAELAYKAYPLALP